MLARLDFAGRSSVPIQRVRKNRAGPAIRDHNRSRAPAARPIPMRPVAIRNHQAVPEWIASLPNLPPDVLGRRAAKRKESDRIRELIPAESQLAADQS